MQNNVFLIPKKKSNEDHMGVGGTGLSTNEAAALFGGGDGSIATFEKQGDERREGRSGEDAIFRDIYEEKSAATDEPKPRGGGQGGRWLASARGGAHESRDEGVVVVDDWNIRQQLHDERKHVERRLGNLFELKMRAATEAGIVEINHLIHQIKFEYAMACHSKP
jgi:hypothetical protein